MQIVVEVFLPLRYCQDSVLLEKVDIIYISLEAMLIYNSICPPACPSETFKGKRDFLSSDSK